jgi:hypothetical protein
MGEILEDIMLAVAMGVNCRAATAEKNSANTKTKLMSRRFLEDKFGTVEVLDAWVPTALTIS